jgi:hypothetical protein
MKWPILPTDQQQRSPFDANAWITGPIFGEGMIAANGQWVLVKYGGTFNVKRKPECTNLMNADGLPNFCPRTHKSQLTDAGSDIT